VARGRRSRGDARKAPKAAAAANPGQTPRVPGRRTAWIGTGIFAASLAIRALFVHATPDVAWGYSVALKGDAALWLEYAQDIRDGRPFELGVPMHPPGTAYLVALLWDGTSAGLPRLRLAWSVLGALTVLTLWVAARRVAGEGAAALAAGFSACSTALIVLSSSVDAETPYLLLATAGLLLGEEIRRRPRLGLLALWGAANALACLLRVEHLLAFVLWSVWLLFVWRRAGDCTRRFGPACRDARALLRDSARAVASSRLARARALQRRRTERRWRSGRTRAIEAVTAGVSWDDEARSLREALPAFARDTASAFVAATVVYRGGSRVSAGGFRDPGPGVRLRPASARARFRSSRPTAPELRPRQPSVGRRRLLAGRARGGATLSGEPRAIRRPSSAACRRRT
jgi:hypothetical protein